jgi:hypothetical protein
MVIIKAVKLIDGLRNTIQEIRNTTVEDTMNKEVPELVEKLGIGLDLPTKRRKRVELYLEESHNDSFHLTENQFYKIQINEVFDALIAHLNWRYTTLNEIANDFAFVSGSVIHDTEASELEKHAVDLAKKYSSDLNGYEFSVEIKSFKYTAFSISKDLTSASPLGLLRLLYDYSLTESYPNLSFAPRIFLTLPVTTASNERSFSKLKLIKKYLRKLIKKYLRSSMEQQRLSGLSILAMEHEVSKTVDFNGVIGKFADLKALKIIL